MLGNKEGRSAYENMLEVFSYIVSFASFYIFVCVAKRYASSPAFSSGSSTWSRLVSTCVVEKDNNDSRFISRRRDHTQEDTRSESFGAAAARLAVCVLGIQVSYLLWGLMQERIMTKPYDTGELFRSSKFLVFANRFLAAVVAYTAVRIQASRNGELPQDAPLYQFSFSSVSNILSSVCQYEALKFVSFPTQVLAKSCKMVPVMLMGFVVNQQSYTLMEYGVAIMITAGAAVFKLYETNDAPVKNTETVGIILIIGYMGCDSFTSNWQSKVFKKYGVDSTVMMMYSNVFSSAFTALGLLVTMEILQVVSFLVANPGIVSHICIMSVCSAVGQLFIFYTIKNYGPLVFATIQTVRQLLSIVLSIIFFNHPVNTMEAFGILLVFSALGGQILHKWFTRKRAAPPASPLAPASEPDDTEHGLGEKDPIIAADRGR